MTLMSMVKIGIFPLSAVIMSWIANNIKPDYKRSTAVPLSASIACCAGLVSSQIYPSVDGPRYDCLSRIFPTFIKFTLKTDA